MNSVIKVLCLHGHPGSKEAMQMFVHHFQGRGIKAIAPDLRGYGNRNAVSTFTMLDHVQDLWDLLEGDRQAEAANGCLTEYLILGWSLGGILAIELGLKILEMQEEPKTQQKIKAQQKIKIAGLILIATAARPRSDLPKIAWWEYANLAIAVVLHRLVPKQRWHIEWFGKRSLIKYLIQQHSQFAYDQIAGIGAEAYLQTSRYAQIALMQALRQGYDRTGDLIKIKVPCLAIAAAQDRHITVNSTAETAKLLPDCEFICYANTAHLLPWEIGDLLLADIDAWCDRRLS